MKTIKAVLFSNWNFMRWARLVIGIIAGVQAIMLHESLLAFLSVFLVFQSLTNTGCCGSAGCGVPQTKTDKVKTEEAEYEEIK